MGDKTVAAQQRVLCRHGCTRSIVASYNQNNVPPVGGAAMAAAAAAASHRHPAMRSCNSTAFTSTVAATSFTASFTAM